MYFLFARSLLSSLLIWLKSADPICYFYSQWSLTQYTLCFFLLHLYRVLFMRYIYNFFPLHVLDFLHDTLYRISTEFSTGYKLCLFLYRISTMFTVMTRWSWPRSIPSSVVSSSPPSLPVFRLTSQQTWRKRSQSANMRGVHIYSGKLRYDKFKSIS